MNIGLLGAGLVGKAIAHDLALNQDYNVTVYDINSTNLRPLSDLGINTQKSNLANSTIFQDAIQDHDLIVGALPGYMGFETVKGAINAHKDIIDISFFAEDPFILHDKATNKDVRVIIDAGVAPGLSNIVLGFADSQLDLTKRFSCYVGGLPKARSLPFEYKAPFSAIDVIEEYIRPARLVENGEIVVKPALSESEFLEFEKIGTLEAFNTDGLRTLLHTMKHIQNMKEKTLRYPGHIEKIKLLKSIGLFSEKEINLKSTKVKPLDVISSLLVEQWKMEPEAQDLTIMQVEVEGEHENNTMKYSFYLYDEYDTQNNILSMARTTGYTASIIVKLLIEERIEQKKGLVPPEFLGKNVEIFEYMLKEYNKRDINIERKTEKIA